MKVYFTSFTILLVVSDQILANFLYRHLSIYTWVELKKYVLSGLNLVNRSLETLGLNADGFKRHDQGDGIYLLYFDLGICGILFLVFRVTYLLSKRPQKVKIFFR